MKEVDQIRDTQTRLSEQVGDWRNSPTDRLTCWPIWAPPIPTGLAVQPATLTGGVAGQAMVFNDAKRSYTVGPPRRSY